jgi:hypothetical protein
VDAGEVEGGGLRIVSLGRSVSVFHARRRE